MGVIGTLQVNIVAHTKKLVDGFKNARKETKNFSKGMKGVGQDLAFLKNAITPLIGAVGFAGFAAAVRQTADELDALGKTADKLGIGVQALSELQFAAERSGVGVNVLNTALQRMVRRISEAKAGTGPAAKALAEMNLQVETLGRLKPEEQFKAIADAIIKFPQADRVRMAMAIFDTEGVALVNTLKDGAEGIERLGEEFRGLSGVITRKEVQKVEDFKDSVSGLGAVLGGFKRDFVIDISGPAKEAVDQLTEIMAPILKARQEAKEVRGGRGVPLTGFGALRQVFEDIGFGGTKRPNEALQKRPELNFRQRVEAERAEAAGRLETTKKNLEPARQFAESVAKKFAGLGQGFAGAAGVFSGAVEQGKKGTREFFDNAVQRSQLEILGRIEDALQKEGDPLKRPIPTTLPL